MMRWAAARLLFGQLLGGGQGRRKHEDGYNRERTDRGIP
jgi:hypothetical protein